MATKSFIKFKPVTSHSERHNFREVTPKYCIEAERENLHVSDREIGEVKKAINENYESSIGRKMHPKSTPIREAVVLLEDDDNDKNISNLLSLTDTLEKSYGIKAFQWHIHNDEGHITEEGEKKYNYHAHILFNWTDEQGKSYKLNKKNMSDIQTLTAEHLEMERGVKGSKSLSLNHHQFRGYLKIKDDLEKGLKTELKKEQEKQIRESILQKIERDEKRRIEKTTEREKGCDELSRGI